MAVVCGKRTQTSLLALLDSNVRYGSGADIGARIRDVCFTPKNGQGVPASRFVERCPLSAALAASPPRPTKKPCKWRLPRALPVGIGAVRRRNPSTALRYSAAAGDATLGELAEWDPEFAEPFAPGALISASGLSERRDFPSK